MNDELSIGMHAIIMNTYTDLVSQCLRLVRIKPITPAIENIGR